VNCHLTSITTMNTQHFTLKSPLLTTRRMLLALACIATVGAANSQSTNLVENGDFKNELSSWKVYSHLPSKKPEASVVDDPVAGSSALQVIIPDVADLKKYQIGFSQPIQAEFGATDSMSSTSSSTTLPSGQLTNSLGKNPKRLRTEMLKWNSSSPLAPAKWKSRISRF